VLRLYTFEREDIVLCGARAIYIISGKYAKEPGRRWVGGWVGGDALSWGGVRHAQRSSVSLADRRDKRLARTLAALLCALAGSLDTLSDWPAANSEEATFD
jgi:hypothetical protein